MQFRKYNLVLGIMIYNLRFLKNKKAINKD